jgi:hypothetical protein
VSFPVVVHALEQLQQDGDEKAGQYLAAILRFEFIISGTHFKINRPFIDIFAVEAVKESEVVINQLTSERNDQTVWDSLFDMAVSIADQFEILPTIPRRPGRQINRANHPADNPSQFWQRPMYYPFLDYYITELTAILLENGGRYQAQYLIPMNLPLA